MCPTCGQVRQSAATLAVLLDENKDEQILKDACLGLCQLFGEGIQNDRIQAILEADVVPRLVTLLKPNKSRNVSVSVQSAALQVIGNVACGDDRQTQVIIDCDALPCLKVRNITPSVLSPVSIETSVSLTPTLRVIFFSFFLLRSSGLAIGLAILE